MRRIRLNDDNRMVECLFEGASIQIPEDIFFSCMTGKPTAHVKFVRYKDGAKLYGMCQSEFNRLAHEARAVYKRNKMALVNTEVLDEYLEAYRE